MRNILLISFIVGIFLPVASMANSSLDTAYKKEYAFLDQQRKSLDRQTSEFFKKRNIENSILEKRLNKLKTKLVNLDVEIESKQGILVNSILSIESNQEDQNRLSQLYEQANSSLGTQTNEKTSAAELFNAAVSMIKTTNKIISKTGEYFLTDGEKVTGTIINVGQVSSFAVGESGTGMLVPAGNGKFKLWKPENTQTAMALNNGVDLDSLQFFLYEDKNEAIDEAKEKTILDVIDSGGIIAWIIVLTGGIAMLMILLRLFFLKRASQGTQKLMPEIKGFMRGGQVKQAIAVCEKQRGAAARVVNSTLRNLDRERDHLEDVVAESILHENTYLNRYGAAIIVVAGVAPLMGLLGTVTGMIETFDIITQFGTGDPKLLSVGISTALVTTQLGLIVAIPALISGNLLSGWSNKIKDNMEQAALSVINLNAFHKQHGKTQVEAA